MTVSEIMENIASHVQDDKNRGGLMIIIIEPRISSNGKNKWGSVISNFTQWDYFAGYTYEKLKFAKYRKYDNLEVSSWSLTNINKSSDIKKRNFVLCMSIQLKERFTKPRNQTAKQGEENG